MHAILDFLQLTSFEPGDLLVVLSLVLLEGMLSCDNAVALAMMVRPLPREQQGRALRYGIVGAYLFLFLALLAATWIVQQWYLKALGGAYLLWLAIAHFRHRHGAASDGAPPPPRSFLGMNAFWSTVVAVELTDLAFSVDSIAAAVALSDKLWVLLLGGMLCILMMRFAAQGFVKLLQRFPRLVAMAFAAVALVGLKLVIEFPLDVLGRQERFAADAHPATAAAYIAAADRLFPPLLAVPHVLEVRTTAAPAPDPAGFAAPDEFHEAFRHWTQHGRQAIHLGDPASALLILAMFAVAFLKRPQPPRTEPGNGGTPE
jgi:YkoY family integral membrane protein